MCVAATCSLEMRPCIPNASSLQGSWVFLELPEVSRTAGEGRILIEVVSLYVVNLPDLRALFS